MVLPAQAEAVDMASRAPMAASKEVGGGTDCRHPNTERPISERGFGRPSLRASGRSQGNRRLDRSKS